METPKGISERMVVVISCAAYYTLTLSWLFGIIRAALGGKHLGWPILRVDTMEGITYASVVWALFWATFGLVVGWAFFTERAASGARAVGEEDRTRSASTQINFERAQQQEVRMLASGLPHASTHNRRAARTRSEVLLRYRRGSTEVCVYTKQTCKHTRACCSLTAHAGCTDDRLLLAHTNS